MTANPPLRLYYSTAIVFDGPHVILAIACDERMVVAPDARAVDSGGHEPSVWKSDLFYLWVDRSPGPYAQ